MDAYSESWRLFRLNLRRNRVLILIFALVPVLFLAATIASTRAMFPTDEMLLTMTDSLKDPIVVAMHGVVQSITVAGYTCWRTKTLIGLIAICFSIVLTVRVTRQDEESGRRDMISANACGRHAPLAAALMTVGFANLVMALLCFLTMTSMGLGAAGAFAHCAALMMEGLSFGALTALLSQLFSQARSARGASLSVLVVLFLIHLVWNLSGEPNGAIALSAMEWPFLIRPYAGEQFWVLLIGVVMALACAFGAMALENGRDIGGGYIPQRPGRSRARAFFRSEWALAFRIHKTMLFTWSMFALLFGFALGASSRTMADYTATAPSLREFAARLGGVDQAFMAFIIYIFSILLSAYAVLALSKLREEEASGRMDALLALPRTRAAIMGSHALYLFLGVALVIALMGLGIGLGAAASTGDPSALGRWLVDCLTKIPAVWAMAGLFALFFGLLPGASVGLSLGAIGLELFIELMWEQHALPDSAFLISPFAHVYPMKAVSAGTLLSLSAAGFLLAFLGFVLFRRRDVRL